MVLKRISTSGNKKRTTVAAVSGEKSNISTAARCISATIKPAHNGI
jgi:hypothetical protein